MLIFVSQAAPEGADGEDNESLGGSCNQLGRPGLGTPSGTWRGGSPRELDRSVSSRLARLSGPGDAAVADAAGTPAADDDACGCAAAMGACLITAAADCTTPAAPAEPPGAAVPRSPSKGNERRDAAGGGQTAQRCAEAARQPPSVSDSVSTLPVSHGRKGELNGLRARRRCCIM